MGRTGRSDQLYVASYHKQTSLSPLPTLLPSEFGLTKKFGPVFVGLAEFCRESKTVAKTIKTRQKVRSTCQKFYLANRNKIRPLRRLILIVNDKFLWNGMYVISAYLLEKMFLTVVCLKCLAAKSRILFTGYTTKAENDRSLIQSILTSNFIAHVEQSNQSGTVYARATTFELRPLT